MGHQKIGDVVKLLLESLPASASSDGITYYFENVGENVKVISVAIEDDKAAVTLSGLTDDELKSLLQDTHKIKKKEFIVKLVDESCSSADVSSGCVSSDCVVLEVSEFDERITKDILEMYFESENSGGEDETIDSITMINKGKAIITFNNSKVVTSILSKSEHTLRKQTLQVKAFMPSSVETEVYELNQIKVETSGTLKMDYISFAIYSKLNLEEDDISLQMLNENSYIVTFQSVFTVNELQEMCKKIQGQKVKKVTFTAELVRISGAILVSNIGDLDEEMIKLHFERKKYGGGKIDKVDIGDGKAIVTFEDHTVVQGVLQKQHEILGTRVTVERWTPACVSGKSTDEGISQFQLLSEEINPLIIKCIQKNSDLLREDLKRLKLSLEFKSDLILVTSHNKISSDELENLKKEVIKLVLSKFTAANDIPVPAAEALSELLEIMESLREKALFEFKFGNKILHAAGTNDVMVQFNDILKRLHDQYTETQRIITLTPSEYKYTDQLILQELKESFPSVLITVNATSGLKLVGSVADVEAVRKSYNKLRKHACVDVELPVSVIQYLHTTGKSILIDYILKKSPRVCVFFSCVNNLRRVQLLCRSLEGHFAHHIVNDLKGELEEVQINFPESFLHVKNKLTDFEETCASFESRNKVMITSSEKCLVIAGFKEDVQHCKTPLVEYIQEKSKVRKSIKIEHGMWKLFNSYMRDRWKEVAIVCESSGINIECDSSQRPTVLYGDRIKLEEILAMVEQLKLSVSKNVLTVQRPGTCTFFKSEKGRLYLDGIEKRVQVAICISTDIPEDEDQEKESEEILDAVKYTMECTAFIKQIKIQVCVGNITEFETDVIVNAANEQLNHCGGVAAAIAAKGGTIIQEDSTRHVRKNGKVDTGDTWLTTQTGKLPCKALIHAVGPTWKGGGFKEEALLYKVCMSCLVKGKSYRSIVFPAISSGIYGFPIKLAAETMVRAVLEFVKNDTSLQNIIFILFPTKDVSAHVMAFISALKAKLPPETVHCKSESRPVSLEPVVTQASNSRSVESVDSVSSVAFDKLKIRQGGLLDVKADVYVNTTNGNLDLSQGAVALSLLKAGGKSLQTECNEAAPINVGEVAVTSGGALSCRHIFHTVLPSYKKHSSEAEKVLKKSIRKCLKLCDQKECGSIAFPSIGTGNLGYPNDVVAKIMIKEVFNYISDQKSSISVHFLVYMKDTFQAFQKEVASYRPQGANVEKKSSKKRRSLQSQRPQNPKPSSPSKESFNIKKLTVTISSGDITESNCDVVVNPTDPKITLTGQGVAGAILAKGGRELKQACDVLSSNGKVLDDHTLVIKTSAPGLLKCKCLFHISFDGNDSRFHKIITECLEKAEREKYHSIAFPAIGTGVHHYPDEKAATGMLNVFYQFSSSDVKYLKHVDIVLFQKATFTKFVQAFKSPSIEEGFFQKAKNLFFKPFSYSAESEVIPVSEPLESNQLEVMIYSETMSRAKEAEKLFYNFLDEMFITDYIDNPLVNELSLEEETQIEKICQSNKVQFSIDRSPLNRIALKGDKTQVQETKFKIAEKIAEIEQRETARREAKQLSQTVQWKRQDSDETSDYYDEDVNYEIECAYKKNSKGQYTYGSYNSGIHFSIDFQKEEETDHINGHKYPVTRESIFEKFKKGDMPKHWEEIPAGSSIHVVEVKPGNQEYTDVVAKFDKTMVKNPKTATTVATAPSSPNYNSIIKIQRIQNLVLYGQYQAKKKEMDKTNKSVKENERWLFHGTSEDTCSKIYVQGFNRSFAGKNATVYGNGVYFARDASYSARNTYSPPDAKGYKYMYLVKVLTGEYTKGNSSLVVPPSKDPSNPAILYDSVVDNVSNPQIFVTFNDASNYPEYLIVFN